MRRLGGLLALVAALLLLLAGGVYWLDRRGEAPLPGTASLPEATPERIDRGRYLAIAGNCAGCHTQRGGADYAGGLGLQTPFGTVYASNLTPHPQAGLGAWSADEFWRAMHHGRSRDGRALYPAFPYPSFTQVTREDSDSIYVYLKSLPAVATPNTPHRLRFPYDTQAALAVWRALFFRPGELAPDPSRPAEWQRGAYLVEGLGHCAACHGPRNSLGATQVERGLSGGLLSTENWYAPSLQSPQEASVAGWPRDEVVRLLQTGVSAKASVQGPMADVVHQSTSRLNTPDLQAIATYLQALPATPDEAAAVDASRSVGTQRDASQMERGSRIYDQRCAYCHGDAGQGVPGAFPALAGNRAVTLKNTLNLVQVIRRGGYLPATAGNPRPHGMPPFEQVLDDEGIAAVLTFIRGSWGNDAPPVMAAELMRR